MSYEKPEIDVVMILEGSKLISKSKIRSEGLIEETHYQDIDYLWNVQQICHNLILVANYGISELNRNKELSIQYFQTLNQNLALLNAHLNFQEMINQDNLFLLFEIGTGSEAKVFRFYDRASKKSYAERLIYLHKKNFFQQLKELIIIFTIIRQENPKLIKFHQIKFQDQTLRILMDYGIGDFESFLDYTKNKNYHLSLEQRKNFSNQIRDQFNTLKSMNIYHRDIKPANMILTEELKIKFTDFGFAEIWDGKAEVEFRACGTPKYWHPEIKRSRNAYLDLNQCDLHSISIVEKEDLNLSVDDTDDDKSSNLKSIEEIKEKFMDFQRSSIQEKLSREMNIDERINLFQRNEMSLEVEFLIQDELKKLKNGPFNPNSLLIFEWIKIKIDKNKFNEGRRFIDAFSVFFKLVKENLDPWYLIVKAQYYALKGYYKEREILFGDNIARETQEKIVKALENKKKCQEAMACYVKAIEIETSQLEGKNKISLASSYSGMANIYIYEENFEKALEYYLKALEVYRTFEKFQILTASTSKKIGDAYLHQKNYKEALVYYVKSLKIFLEKLQGEYHTSVSSVYSSLGILYFRQDRYSEALVYYHKSLKIDQKILGEHHLSVANTYSNIGSVFKRLSNYENALLYYQKALKILNEYSNVDADHSKAAICSNIGQVYTIQGWNEQAIDYSKKSLEIYCQIYGENHSAIAIEFSNIGNTYVNMSKYTEALKFYFKSVEIDLKIQGKESEISLAETYINIGAAYSHLSDYEEALRYLSKSLDINHRSLNSEMNTTVASAYKNIGIVYSEKAEYKKAIENLGKSLNIFLKIFGENNESVAGIYSQFGTINFKFQKYEEALKNFFVSRDIFKSIHGEYHTSVTSVISNIAIVYRQQSKFEEAKKLFLQTLEINMKLYEGDMHTTIARNYTNLGTLYCQIENYDKALEYLMKSLHINRTLLGGEHHSVIALLYHNIGCVYQNKKKFEEALQFFFKSVTINKGLTGELNDSVINSYTNIGHIYFFKGENEEAFKYIHKAISISIQIFGEKSVPVADLYRSLGIMYYQLGYVEKAHSFLNESLCMQESILGQSHPSVMELRKIMIGMP